MRLLVQERDRERVDPFADAARATAVASIGSDFPGSRTASRSLGQRRRDPDDPLAASSSPRSSRPDTCRQSSTAHTRSWSSSAANRSASSVPVVAGRDRQLPARRPGYRIERDQRVRALVRVHPDHDHLHRPFVGMA